MNRINLLQCTEQLALITRVLQIHDRREVVALPDRLPDCFVLVRPLAQVDAPAHGRQGDCIGQDAVSQLAATLLELCTDLNR